MRRVVPYSMVVSYPWYMYTSYSVVLGGFALGAYNIEWIRTTMVGTNILTHWRIKEAAVMEKGACNEDMF
jgi:hypothetical protein